MRLENEKSGRVVRAFFILCLLTIALAGASCRRTSVENANAGGANSNSASTDNTSTTPPFSTKEPERYQATVITSGSLGEQSPLGGLTNRQMFIARDGDRRRFEYEPFPGMKLAYLQQSGQRYLLYPEKKMYAEIKPGEGDAAAATPDVSADKLINEARTGARYEKLGAEDLNGRPTTKYRVTSTGQTGDAKSVSTESIIWIDEQLQMPVKVETTSTGGTASGSKVSMEIRDIKQEVDPALFELPKNYKKVTREDILSQLFPNIVGADREENAATKGNKKR